MTMVRRLAATLIALALLAALGPASAVVNESRFNQEAVAARQQIVLDPQAGLQTANRLGQEAARFETENSRRVATATVDWLRAEALIRLDQPKRARQFAEEGLARVSELGPETKLVGDLILARGGAAAATGNIQLALSSYQNAYRIYRNVGAALGEAMALHNLGSLYNDAGDFENALKYEQQAADAYPGDPALLVAAYNTRGNALIELGRASAAELEYGRALVAARALKSPLLETRILQNLARSQADSGRLAAAEVTIAKARQLARSGPAANWRPALDGVAALIALKQGRLDDAAALIDRTFASAQAVQATMPLRDFHQTAYQIFRKRGEEGKALAHLEAFERLDDQKRALTASANAALMSARFDFANQNAKIAQRDKMISETQARFRTTVLVGLLTAAAIISALLLVGFFSIKRSRDQVRAANATLRATNAELAKALAAKTEFLATTSHEIRTPLNGILGMTQVILADRELAESLRHRIELVHGAGETMRALVDDILDVAKMETGELQIHPAEMNLRRLLEDAGTVWSGQADTKKIGIELDIAQCPDGIVADEVRLRQIVFNLMSNAIKFTDRGQVRLVAASETREGAGERLIIRIADSGIGIPADRMEDIFESFRQVDGGTTRRHGGTGLGLAICRNLARAMGGDVTVTSVPGAGSTFTLDLPLERADVPTPADANERTSVNSLAEAQLLLVEINPLSQGILRALLGPHVHGLNIVSDADAAIAAVERGGIDHVVADGATLGLSLETVEHLVSITAASGARLTLLWPSPDADAVAELTERGVTHLLSKPMSAPDLLAALKMVYTTSISNRDIAA